MKVSVLIGFYKRLDKLELILKAFNLQSNKNFEVIIAEDNNAEETKTFLDTLKPQLKYPVFHVFQDDIGFRKNKILNQAIIQSSGDVLAFLDGDCIPHCEWISEIAKNISNTNYLVGRRVMLSNALTQDVLTQKKYKLNFFNTFLSKSFHIEESLYLPFSFIPRSLKNKGLYGCNWAILKSNMLAINGFDEDYIKAGVGEDTDIEWRIQKIGLKPKSMKFKAIVFHLDHKSNYSPEEVAANLEMYFKKKDIGNQFCINGIKKLE